VLDAEVEGRRGATPYVLWVSRFGLWPLALTALLLIVACGRFRKVAP
jgi:apolipoprotein N-acyltransferase